MTWSDIIAAAAGRPKALDEVICRSRDDDVAVLKTLLLLEETPHPAAALVAAATSPEELAPPIQAALAPSVAPALAAWRADPLWVDRAVGATMPWGLAWGVAGVVGALRDRPADLCAAVDIVLHMGSDDAVARCLKALSANGWEALGEDRRGALLTRAAADDLGWVWGALDDAQRAAAVQAAADHPSVAAVLIGRIGADAWRATAPPLRERLLSAAACASYWMVETAPAWAGMTDDERKTLATAAVAGAEAMDAFLLLERLDSVGRATLAVAQRAALDARARTHDPWRVLTWRAADAGWGALKDDERRAVLAAAEAAPWRVAVLLRDVGAAGWRAMAADEQARIAGAVRRDPDVFFRCPPTLWTALAGDDPPPATDMPADAPLSWRAEDADADLGGLPPSHQALVLALAPWRPEDAAPDSVRGTRLRAAWNQTSADARAALATAHPLMLAPVAAAAHMCGGASVARAAVGATAAWVVTATGGSDAKRAVGAMLRDPARWRSWMIAFAPTDDDPPEAWAAWEVAVRRGVIDDVTLCARLAAKEREESNRSRALRRA